MSTHRHNGGFILKRFVVLIALAFGLIWAKLETNVQNLWMEGERCRCLHTACRLYKYALLTKCEVKMAYYWSNSFLCVFMERDGVEA